MSTDQPSGDARARQFPAYDDAASKITPAREAPDSSIADRFMRLFAGLPRAHGHTVLTGAIDERGKREANSNTIQEPVTPDLWRRHLKGEVGLGILPLRDDSTCNFGAIDVDEYDGLDHAALAKSSIEQKLGQLTVCKSKSGGAHIYLFSAEPVPATKMQSTLEMARRALGLPQNVEIFPKSDAMEPGRFSGGWVNMPYFGDERRAIRPDGTEMTIEEFLDHAEARRVRAPREEEPAPTKDYQRGPVEGNRYSYVKSDLGRYLQAHPESTLEQLLSYAEHVRGLLDPPLPDSEWRKWNVRKLCLKLLAKQGEGEPPRERSKSREELILKTEGEVRGHMIARNSLSQIHLYDEGAGRYVFDDHETFLNILRENFGNNKKPYVVGDGDKSRLLLNLNLGGTPKFWEDPRVDQINVKNGILDVEKLTLLPHTPDFLHPNQFDVPFDPEATCPNMDKFLSDVLYEDEVPLFYEMLGYSLIPDVSLQTAFLLHGFGANGKSQFLEMLMYMLGRRNYSTVPLQKLESNNFAGYSLVGKLANVESDMTANRLPGSAFFKSVVGGDPVFVEKKYHDGRSVKLYTRLFFSCNRYPRSSDNSLGFFRKWLILPFSKKNFDRDNRSERKPPNELLVPLKAEAPGILNKSVRALLELRGRHGEFTQSARMLNAKLEFMSLTDNLSAWLDEHTIVGENVSVVQQQLRAAFNLHSDENDCPRISEKEFSQKVHEYRPNIKTDQKHGVRYFMGLGMKADQSYTPF